MNPFFCLFVCFVVVVFTVFCSDAMRAALPYMGMPSHAHSTLPVDSAHTPLHSAPCLMDYCQHFVWDDPIKVLLFFSRLNEEQLRASTKQKLIPFLCLMDLFHVHLFTSWTSIWTGLTAKLLLKDCMLLCCVEEREARAVSIILSVS